MSAALLKLIGWRLVAGVGVLWGAATLTFLAMNLTGGDMAIAILGGPDALPTPEILAKVREDYGLDQPLPIQYLQYLGRLATGDFGESYRLKTPVLQVIAPLVGPTATLAIVAAVVAILASVALAVLTAHRAPWLRSAASGVELVLTSAPSFVLGILLLMGFAFQLHLFPVAGSDGWRALVLPVLTLAIPATAMLTQVLRQELEEVLEQPFITMARARGMPDAGVRLVHALRHALTSLITLTGFLLAFLLGGAVITENLFARQGLGRLMVEATTNSDVPIVLGVTLLAALVYVLVNLVVDVLNAIIDPQVRVGA
jgi:peptide/nickel transport system permease protein